ncbi:3-phosphoshikimate 1-carboxyvinyltransferase domain protein, partial [Chlamydia psittaci C1/97]
LLGFGSTRDFHNT